VKLYVPYTEIQPHTKMVLTGFDYTPVQMKTDTSYIKYFQDRWREGESFINCEHDVVFWCGAVAELERCPYHWCAFGLQESDSFKDGRTASFNLMLFSDTFIELYPDIWDEVLEERIKGSTDYPLWHGLDYLLTKIMREKYYIYCHQHYPYIINANPIRHDVEVCL